MTISSSGSSEEAPLLPPSKHEEVYLRFKPAKKRGIVAIVSLTGLLALFVSGTFVPSIPQIAKDLNSTPAIVSLAVSSSILAASLGSLIGATYSGFYGRKPIYLIGTPLLFAGSVGAAAAQSVPQLIFWRVIQSLGASPGLAVGSGVIGDIYKLEERGRALGIFFSAVLAGPALAPLVGGFAAHYFSWRLLQLWLGFVGLIVLVIVIFFFPETFHPGERGIDKADRDSLPKWRPVLLNPLKPLWMLRSPNLLAVTLAGFTTLLTDYVLLVPLAFTIGKKYGISNEAVIGACFLPAGLGNMIGAPLAGYIADQTVIRCRKQRGGEWYPEDRLRATYIGSLFLVPMTTLCSGLLTHYVSGRIGLILNLVCIFFNGIGVDFVLSPSAAYVVDLMHARSAEAMAANNGFRAFVMSLFIAGILPSVERYGVLITDAGTAIIAWIGFGLIVGTIRYGDRLRAVINVGFSTAENN
ncbi:MFS general substrate transporter [Pholiota conissans]|uniref:MFS general substrate transporter n=1 Tax=Pholiota conissans TaxID=109636 RepID=A0A9P6D2P4_9AGAR|nr:MFS general substrate transporter [Pholiota conissans]